MPKAPLRSAFVTSDLSVKCKTMEKPLIIVLMFSSAIIIGGSGAYFDYKEVENFEAIGEVIETQWNTENHQMSLFKIKTNSGVKQLHHYRVTLTSEQISVGDLFVKESGSKMCKINGHRIQCVK